MVKITILITTFLFAINIAFGQRPLKVYKIGLEYFKQKEYVKADSMFSIVLQKRENNDVYFDRGVTRLYMKDSCGYCQDMKSALEMHDEQAKRLYKLNCIKFDQETYKLYLNGYNELKKKNYEKADSLLTISINSYSFIENVFSRGIARLYMKDTSGFCNDMKTNMPYNANAFKNYTKICTDTMYFDKSFLNTVNKSLYFEIEHKSDFLYEEDFSRFGIYKPVLPNKNKYGYVYDLTLNYSSIAGYCYIDSFKVYYKFNNSESFKKRLRASEYVSEYVNENVYIPKEIKRLLKSVKINEFILPIICVVSENGNIIYCKYDADNPILANTELDIKDIQRIKDTLFEIANKTALSAPKNETFIIGGRYVKTYYTLIISFKI